MKKLLLIFVFIAAASAAEWGRQKRSPIDWEDYFKYRAYMAAYNTGAQQTQSRTSASNFGMPFNYPYFFDFDDRRKRQVDHPAKRQKRSADFDFEDYFRYRAMMAAFNPRPSNTGAEQTQSRTSSASNFDMYYMNPYFFDFDDRRKRQVEHPTKRQKRSADFDFEDYYRYRAMMAAFNPRPSNTGAEQTQSRTSASNFDMFYMNPYFFDFDDRRKRHIAK